MGNCWRKRTQDPNQPDGITGPPPPPTTTTVSKAGANEIQISHSSSGIPNPKPVQRGSFASSDKRKRKKPRAFLPNRRDRPLEKVNRKDEVFHAYKLNCFCYSMLKAATHKFSTENLLGRGGSGDVYKGWIDHCTMTAAKPNDGLPVAVKRLRKAGTQGHNEWLNELRFLSRLNHPNIVRLIGYCCENEHRILVCEYMTNGNLEANLLIERNIELNWSRRIKIAVGAAKGLDYLHGAGWPVIHRDIKASNVLLNTDLTAKLSDFGLAKFGPQSGKSHISTAILGTRGYFAPEYIATGHLTLKTDVYSFGVVLLEILSGSSAVKKYTDGAAGNLAQWAKPYLSNKLELHHVIDKNLGKNFRMEEAQDFAEIILQCLNSNPRSRPTMIEVVAALEQLEQNIGSCIQHSIQIGNHPKMDPLLTISLGTKWMSHSVR